MITFKAIATHIRNTRERASGAYVSGPMGGHPLGEPPGTGDPLPGRGTNVWAGGDGYGDGRGVSPYMDAPDASESKRLPARRHPPIIMPDIRRGSFSFVRSNDALWWDSEHPVQDILGNRHTRHAIDGYASVRAWGSSSQRSGPEGTLVLMPPRIPRQLATPRSIAGARAGNVLLNYANTHMQTPDVPVVRQ